MQTTSKYSADGASKLLGVSVSALTLILAGCGLGNAGNTAATTTAGAALKSGIHGVVHGGQQPVANATIQLYQIGTGGNGTAATPLLNPASSTDGGGNFNITGQYTCAPNTYVYMTATGGNPGLAAGTNNSALVLMAGLGSCAALQANAATTEISLDEVTTVATVYSLSSFVSGYANVAYNGKSASGIINAYQTQTALANTAAGSAQTSSAGISLPTLRLNTLADAIAACINSTGPSSTGCSALFTAAQPAGSPLPTDVVGALVNIVHNPLLNVAAIYSMASSTAPFQPSLATFPNDTTLPIIYSGGGLALPASIAIDANGNAWVANEGGTGTVTEITTGAFVSGTTGYVSKSIVGPQGIAVDALGNVWVANTGANNVLELNASGAITNTLTAGIGGPVAVALDGSNNVWISNYDSSTIAAFSNNGTPLAGSPFSNAAVVNPTGIAVDPNNDIWVGNSGTGVGPGTIAEFNSTGVYQNAYSDGLLVAPGGVAIDPNLGQIYTAATGIGAVTGLTQSGAFTAAGGGLSTPLAVAVDGASTVWSISYAATGSVSAFSSTGVALTSGGIGSLNLPSSLALDASGNLWTTDMGDNTVTQFVGLSAPTATPLQP